MILFQIYQTIELLREGVTEGITMFPSSIVSEQNHIVYIPVVLPLVQIMERLTELHEMFIYFCKNMPCKNMPFFISFDIELPKWLIFLSFWISVE